jgi:hypothetical protein
VRKSGVLFLAGGEKMDHLEAAQAAMKHLESLKAGYADPITAYQLQTAIAHSLIDIAETLRWLKEQKDNEIQAYIP